MRILAVAALLVSSMSLLGACGIDQLMNGGGAGSESASDAGAGEGGADAGVTGQGCGVDGESGATLCRVTSQCPTVLVDSESFPHCGFRIKGSSVDLICACGRTVCGMGAYTNCAQAAKLLTTQTEQGVCLQEADQRCEATTTTSSSSSSSSSGASGTCDKDCLSQCGGGAACASVCGC
jgi:hypothetical protein